MEVVRAARWKCGLVKQMQLDRYHTGLGPDTVAVRPVPEEVANSSSNLELEAAISKLIVLPDSFPSAVRQHCFLRHYVTCYTAVVRRCWVVRASRPCDTPSMGKYELSNENEYASLVRLLAPKYALLLFRLQFASSSWVVPRLCPATSLRWSCDAGSSGNYEIELVIVSQLRDLPLVQMNLENILPSAAQ